LGFASQNTITDSTVSRYGPGRNNSGPIIDAAASHADASICYEQDRSGRDAWSDHGTVLSVALAWPETPINSGKDLCRIARWITQIR